MPASQRQLDQVASRALSRLHLRRTRVRVLCPICRTLQTVDDIRPLAKVQVLQCGHTRQP